MNDEQGRYYRLSPKFWSDPMVMRWDDDTRLLALYLLTCPHRTTEGLFRLPKLYAMADLEWSAERFTERLHRLVDDGFIEWDPKAEVVLIVKALTWQAPANPNQVKAAVKQLAMVPPTPLKARFKALAERYCERLSKGLPEGFGEGFLEGSGEPHAPSPPPSQVPPGGNDEPFVARLANELRDDHGCEFDRKGTLHEAFHDLLTEAVRRLPDDRHHGTAMGVIADFVERAQGMAMTREARSHTARLVRTHDPVEVLDGFGQALAWGAGVTAEYADDPLALSKYVAGVLTKRGAA